MMSGSRGWSSDGPKILGKYSGSKASLEDVCIRNSQRAALAVACRTRLIASILGAKEKQAILPEENRAPTSSNSVDINLRSLDSNTCGGGLKDILKLAGMT